MDRAQWISSEISPPIGTPVLIWCDGSCAVGIAVEGSDEDGPWRIFMNSRSDELLTSPTHWMPLPAGPA